MGIGVGGERLRAKGRVLTNRVDPCRGWAGKLPARMSGILVTDVRKVFPGGHAALDGVTLDVREGEYLALVGPSGCGKTTLLRVIAGLETPDSGGVLIGGREMLGVSPAARGVALVFQHPALYPHMNVRANMAFGLLLAGLGRSAIEERLRHVALTLGLEGMLDRAPHTLSGGERQRVALGKAMAMEPACLLLDEPLAGLDPALREAAGAELRRIQQRLGVTTIHVTHDHAEALAMGDRVGVMHAGRVVQAGTPAEVYTRPINRFVAGFVGWPRMNLIEGEIVRDGGLFFRASDQVLLEVPARVAGAMGEHVNGQVTLGVRAGDVRISREGGGCVGVVERVWWAGDGVLASCVIGGVRVEGRAGEPVSPGDRVSIGVDASRVHFFRAGEEGRAMGPGEA